jgi:putative DNA methylase
MNELVTHLFGRQAIPMAWDFAEANPFSESGGNFSKNLSYVAMGIDYLAGCASGHALQVDAATNVVSRNKVVSTDPPYYDNIAYADLSDYFYVWLRPLVEYKFFYILKILLLLYGGAGGVDN